MDRTHWASQSFPEQKTSILSQQKTRRLLAAGQQLLGLLFRKALACPVRAVVSGSTRRGLTRGEESEEGGDSVRSREDGAKQNINFSMFLGHLKIDAKMIHKK